MRISKSKAAKWFLAAPLLFFGLPLGLGNGVAQPIAALLLMPYFMAARKRLIIPFLFVILISTASLYQVYAFAEREHSFFHFLRAGLPLFAGCIILCGYNDILRYFANVMDKYRRRSTIIVIIYLFILGQALQTICYFRGIHLYNSIQENSLEEARVMLFPNAGTQLIFFYACYTKRFVLMVVAAFVLFASGSKVIFASMALLAIVGLIRTFHLREFIFGIVALCLIAALAIYGNTTALDRFSDFVSEDKLEDVTRSWEVMHAKATFFSGVDTMIFGGGLGTAITPGIQTDADPRWTENSKYDTENGFWAILSKIGSLGTLIYASMFLFLPKNRTFVAICALELISAAGVSYLFFIRYEGPYLLIWSIVINFLEGEQGEPSAKASVSVS